MKRKININREKLSAEEITGRRDFGSLMKSYTGVKKPFWKHQRFILGMSASLVAAAALVFFTINKGENKVHSRQQDVSQVQHGDFTYNYNSGKPLVPFINPPLKNIDVPFTDYEMDASRIFELNYSSGSKIKIPADAFRNADGKPVKGKVNVRYREFHDPVDFFVSGIPMTYDSGGMHYTFESAGMIEIYAFQNGKVLKVNPEKPFQVKMATKQDGGGYNLYYLDTAAKNWIFMGKDKIVKEKRDEFIAPASDTAVTSVANLTFVSYTAGEQQQLSGLLKELDNIHQDIKNIETTEPVRPRKVNKQKRTFDFDISLQEFPEFAAYKNVWFEIADENKNLPADLYKDKITWDDVYISEGKTKGSYIITLSKGKKKYEVVAYPVFEGKNYDDVMTTFDAKFKEYTVKLNARKKEEQEKQAAYDALIKQVQNQQDAYEKQMKENWKKQEEQLKKQMERLEMQDKIFRVFTISGFGVYNCDSPHLYPRGANLKAVFADENNTNLQLNGNVYLVDRSRNALFAYYGNPCADFQFNPASSNIIWSTTPDQQLAVFFDEQFADIKSRSGVVTFKMKLYAREELSSLEKLKSLLRIGEEFAKK